jgi:phasin family protein
MSKTTGDKATPKAAVKAKVTPRRGARAVPSRRTGATAREQQKAVTAARRRETPPAADAPRVTSGERPRRFDQDGLQAYARTGSIMVKGFEDLSREVALYAQATLEVNVAAAKAMTEAKSLDEVLDLQSKAARESFDIMLAEGAKLTELSLDLATKSMAPVQAQVDKAVATLLKSPAA